MESSEDDRGIARDVVEQPPTRENTEMLSEGGDVCSPLTSVEADGQTSRSMESRAHSSVRDEDCYNNTETILNMIDEFIEEPKVVKSARYTADSTVSGHSPHRGTLASAEPRCKDRSTDNCVSENPQDDGKSSVGVTGNRCHIKDKQLEDMVNDISSSSTNQGALDSEGRIGVTESNTICNPTESCSKAENLPGLRRKLVRPALPKEAIKPSTDKHPGENFCVLEDKQDDGLSNSTQTSPKKVKLVRNSGVKAKPLLVTHLPPATPIQSDATSCLSSTAGDSDKVNDRLRKQSSSESNVISKPLDSHSTREWLVNAHEDNVNSKDSDNKELSSASKLDRSEVKPTTNSLSKELADEDTPVVNKSNDVLDVRKVLPLRLNLSTIDESLNFNNKNSAVKQLSTDVQHNDIANQLDVEESKNNRKLTFKLVSKQNDEGKTCSKVSRLNIKPIKSPDVVADSLPACSKSKHIMNDEHSSEGEENIPNVIKLNIKPLHKPADVESDNCKESKSSSSSEVSECDSSENEVTSECIQSPIVETSDSGQGERSVPKLTIKSLSTIPKVDCDSHKHKVGRRSQSPEPLVVPKLHIKPLIPPPIEKMTIKLNKSHESESKCETESVPKITIKLGKVQENTAILENNCDDEKGDCALKMKIKLGKSIENSIETNLDSSNEHCSGATRSSRRINQKLEQEQHVPKLTIKIPQDHEVKSSEKSSNSPSIPKVTIKPIIKPGDVEGSHSPKLTNEAIPKSDEIDSKCDGNVEHPTIPKLTIKPIVKSDDHNTERSSSPIIAKLGKKTPVKQDELESKLSDTTDCHGVPKLTIKTVKTEEHDSKYHERVRSPIPKLTIKPILQPASEDDSDNNESPSRSGNVFENELLTVPKITIKPVIKYDENDLKHSQGPSSPSIPKLTIKTISKHDDSKTESLDTHLVAKPKNIHEQELRRSERCASPSVPKVTIKPVTKLSTSHETTEPVEVPIVHKLIIKPVLKPDEQPLEESSDAVPKSVIISENEGLLTKISIKNISKASESEAVKCDGEKSDEAIIRTRSKASLEETISKLSSKTKIISETNVELDNDIAARIENKSSTDDALKSTTEYTIKPVPEELTKPLEVLTASVKCSPSHQESGLDSPRIILKINKCAQGSVAEVQVKTTEVNSTTNVVNNVELFEKETVTPHEKEDVINVEPPVETQKEPSPTKNENLKEKVLNNVEDSKQVEEKNETSKENDEQHMKGGIKRLRNRDTLLNKGTDKNSATPQTKRHKLDNTITNLLKKSKRNSMISLVGSKDEKINADDGSSCNSTDAAIPNNGETNFKDVLSNIDGQIDKVKISDTFEKINESMTMAEGDSNMSSASSDEPLVPNQHGTDSPIFNKVDRNMLVINDETNSQESMMIDELSQDPLDIESAAKSHFAPVVAPTTKTVMSIKDSIKIVDQSPRDIALSLGLTPQPKKRGRPRKNPLPEDHIPTPAKPPKEPKISPKLPTPALEERPVRVLRTPRERPAILRTPRTRGGRGRGGNRRGGGNSSVRDMGTSPPDSPNDKSIKFFKLTNDDTNEFSNSTTPCKVTLDRLIREDSGDDDDEILIRSVRGRGGGRIRRGRGSRGGRGKGSRGGLLKGGQRGEEIQLQDALPLTTPLGRREGRKSKLEPTLTPALQVFEEETCMIGDNVTPKRNIGLVDEESQSSVLSSQTVSESGTRSKRPKLMDMLDEGHKEWTPADIAEYDWPPEGFSSGEPSQTVMVQEQVALYLGVKSFKRRYPDLKRRPLSAEEKNYIRDRGLISEALCDLGVTAVDAGEVLDIMFTDYPDKYEEYRKHLREKRETKPTASSTSRFTMALTPAKQAISRQEILEKACESAASWNAQLNKQRKTQRVTSMDLQTLTLHRPKRPPVIQEPNPSSISYYPVALLPGQFTDYYRDYTPEELRYFPLNTVMNLLPSPKQEIVSSSDESESNSDSEGSSRAESDSETSILETNSRRKAPLSKTKPRQSVGNTSRPISPTIDSTAIKTENNGTVKSEVVAASSSVIIPNKCKLCEGSEFANKRNPNEAFITCSACRKKIHPSCLDMSTMVTKCVRGYAWQCADCKCCGHCGDLADDDKMLFCDLCDRGYHIYCVGLKKVPTGRWHCIHCAACRSCDTRTPSGPPGIELPGPGAPPDQWHHHFRRTNSGERIYSHTMCAPCAKAWRSGRFCPSCEKCFVGRKGAMGLVICVRCDMRYHQECIRLVRKQLDVLNFLCTNCRRGINPKHKLRRGEKTPRKTLHLSADSSMHSIVTDSNSSMQNTSSMMDQGDNSSSAIDSMQPSPSQDRNDSDSISDVPLDMLKSRRILDQNEDSKNSENNETDFKSASRRLFSVGDASIPSNTSEYRIPGTARPISKKGVKEEVSDKGSNSEETKSSETKDSQGTDENVEGGA